MREERARVKTDDAVGDAERAETLKRLDGVAAILAKAAARDTSLITLLEPSAAITDGTRQLKRKMLTQAGIELPEAEETETEQAKAYVPPELAERQLAVPDRLSPAVLELMPHQARFLAGVRDGHRSFLLADEPGLGKTAQSVIAASVAGAYPLLVVVPNVVKMNWAREVQRWTPQRRVTVIHGDGDDVDAFADVFVVNYDILDRHLSWISGFGFQSMVVDEAHMIKNTQSQRSRNVLAIAERIRERTLGSQPLLIALTGTPLINEVDDFRAIWRFFGWT
ncbi:hypothetical protein FQR65_LT20614 [Abscondita terminalis]|nr:hypothetical protein FQR65_LT20614 [Abscondita terminalis]